MKWFRLYSEVLDDPKVQQLHPAMFKHWVNLLCLASQTDEGGMLPDEESIAFRLRVRKSELRKILDTLCAAGLLDRGENSTTHVQLSVHKWSERQRKSDDVSQRVARHRAGNAGNETLQETLPKRTVEEEGDTDKRRGEGEGEKNVPPDKPARVASQSEPFEALMALCEATGADVALLNERDKGKQLGKAKQLLAAGMTVESIGRCAGYLASQSWRTSTVDLFTVESERGRWELAGMPTMATEPPRNGSHAPPKTAAYHSDMAKLQTIIERGDTSEPIRDGQNRVLTPGLVAQN